MLMLPLSTHLRLGRRPYVTYAVALLCFFIYLAQGERNAAIDRSAESYCRSIHQVPDETQATDMLVLSQGYCENSLKLVHSLPDWVRFRDTVVQRLQELDEFTDEDRKELDEEIAAIERHYADFRLVAPPSLDARLMYDPSLPNPLRMVTSSLAHADWMHIIGNLIFFLAFAPALELLAGSALRFIGVMLIAAFAGSIFYTLFAYGGGWPVPSLGLSGVVMGMIGFSAYMMPHARIRTFVWFLHFARFVFIPAWILAVWYIGWDAWTLLTEGNSGGVNLVAHVFGGLSGYLAGVLFFRKLREEYREELDDEIEFMRSQRDDRLGIMSSYKGQQKEMLARERQRVAENEYHAYLDKLHRLVSAGQASDAVLVLLERYDLFSASPETYESIFNEMKVWRTGRTWLCLGRLLIDLLMERGKTGRALHIARQCVAVDPEFALGSSAHLLPLAQLACDAGERTLAQALLRNASSRYAGVCLSPACLALEQELQAMARL